MLTRLELQACNMPQFHVEMELDNHIDACYLSLMSNAIRQLQLEIIKDLTSQLTIAKHLIRDIETEYLTPDERVAMLYVENAVNNALMKLPK